MINTRLLIENQEIELTKPINFAINRSYIDLQNPIDVINDWSKTVSIPATANNNKLFGHIFRPDMVTEMAGSSTIGVHFDPNKKLDMKLIHNDDLVMHGYAKLSDIKKTNGEVTYQLNLFGELGKLFSEAKKITFYPAVEEQGYYIDGTQYFNQYINRMYIHDDWTAEWGDSWLYPVTNCSPHHIVGFTPLNSFSSEFDYGSYQTKDSSTASFEDTLKDFWTTTSANTDIDTKSLIGSGLLPRQFGEFRSYLQQPYIFFNKLFEIFAIKFQEITGYELVMDENWKSTYNPYWTKLVVLGNTLDKATEPKRSGDRFSLNDIWNNEYTPFDIILNYCKIFGFIWDVDYTNKRLNVIHRYTYFKDYTIEDWTDKVDYSQDFTIKPVSFDNKYMVFNYDKNNSADGTHYREKYGIEYGAMKVNTGYAFNSEQKDVFDKIPTSITYTPNVLTFADMLFQNFVYIGTSDVMLNLRDKDEKTVDSFGSFYFYHGTRGFDARVAITPHISDDTVMQNILGKYMYVDKTIQESCYVNVDRYSVLNVYDINTANMILFNKPSVSYDSTNNYANGVSIYNRFWADYINEIYSINNKKVTCYIRINPTDYNLFKFNKFITINQVLYMIDKIYDYSPENLTTKVDLLQITNPTAYSGTLFENYDNA